MKYKNPYIEFCLDGPHSIFKSLSQKEKETIVQYHTYAQYRKGELLLKEGEKPHGLICLTSGKVKIFKEGVGGRNQEVVLASLYNLDKKTIIASFDSDGWDNTSFAGAIGDMHVLEKSKKLGINPQDFLKDNNSYSFFKHTQDGIITDRLPSNVSDLIIIYKV